MRSYLLFASFFYTFGAFSQISIIPQPASLKELPGFFPITTSTKIVCDNNELMPSAKFLQAYINKFYKLNLKISSGPSTPSSVVLQKTAEEKKPDGKALHSYSLLIEPKSFLLSGTSPEAVFNGVQTIIQLLPLNAGPVKIPCVNIQDQPRFEYRGLHLDVGRHYLPIDFIKKYIDYIALHKMNYFHWHLTEDQGWRIEIKKYPKLTEVGAWRNGTIIGRFPGTGNDKRKHGGFYTQEQIKEIVKYAADRYIDVIPEIELPGHSSAAIAAYPQLSCFPDEPTINYFPKACVWNGDSSGKQVQQTWGVFDDVFCAGKDGTFNFLQDVMDEVMTLFPSKYIHVGGDECPKKNWKRCPSCQARMKANGLKDEHELQSYFIQRMEKYLNAKGKILIGWDEILEGGLAPKAVVMSWRGEQGGIDAAKEHHDVIMTPGSHVYLDHSQSENEDSVTIGGYTPLEKTYSYEPIPAALTAEQGKYVLGAQGNVWTEYMENPRKVEYMIFPRLGALSEVLWSPKEKRNWSAFEKKLSAQFKRYEIWKANYSKAYFDLKSSVLPSTDNNGILWKLESKFQDANIQYTIGSSTKTSNYSQPVKINSTNNYTAKLFLDNKLVRSFEQSFYFNKATGQKITLAKEPSKSYPGNGAFTLVDGIQNTKGTARSKEFLGFNGEDCAAVIDLGSTQTISSVTIHSYKQTGSWIWRPLTLEVFLSQDGKNFTSSGLSDDFIETKTGNGTMTLSLKSANSRYLKVVVKNWGEIPAGEAGAGNKAWLFLDEIEVN